MKAIITTWLFLVGTFASAQNILSSKYNALRSDSLNNEIIPYVEAGYEGENVVWDFTSIEYDEEPDTTNACIYNVDDRLLWDCNGFMTTYRQTIDSLLICREETPLYEMNYNKPLVKIIYPFGYGSSFSKSFSGIGAYKDKLKLYEDGISVVKGDACGILIIAPRDTIRNVLRVNTRIESTLDVQDQNGSLCKLNRIVDMYEWYARGYRYPVFKTTADILIYGNNVIHKEQTAERMTPELQQILVDKENELIRPKTSERTGLDNFDVIIDNYNATASYNLTTDALVNINLANSSGIVYWRYSAYETAGNMYYHDIPLSGLVKGQYGININVNGIVKSKIINVQ